MVLLSEIAHLQDLKTLAKSYIVALVESSAMYITIIVDAMIGTTMDAGKILINTSSSPAT